MSSIAREALSLGVYFLALAADYDGTLAQSGRVDEPTLAALTRLKESGRRLLLVTGRRLPELEEAFPQLETFDRVVAENGALVFDPAAREERVLAEAPPAAFVEMLERRGVGPLAVGRAIVATWEPHEKTVLDVIRDMGLELQIIFNKGAVMILPAGVSKATGLAAALEELGLSPHNVVAVGDAENDHAFMTACGAAAAVANALPAIKRSATLVLEKDHGAGVADLVERMLRDDSALIAPDRHALAVGEDAGGEKIAIAPHLGSVLIAGSSGIGKSTLATALTERMAESGFEFCIFDPEGDYDELENAVCLGDSGNPPQAEEALDLLERVGTNVVVNTQNFNMNERPTFFAQLLPRVASLRARCGRPHWLLVDEAHHLVPAKRSDFAVLLPESMPAVVFITVHPDSMATEALQTVGTVIALGDDAVRVIETFCRAIGVSEPRAAAAPRDDEVLYWNRNSAREPHAVKVYRPHQTHRRHTRKYAEGDLGDDGSFYFRGEGGQLNLRAQNLQLFLQIADGVDERTWQHHRRAHDYSSWFRHNVKDEELAAEAEAIEDDGELDAAESRARIAAAVKRRYTAPAAIRDER